MQDKKQNSQTSPEESVHQFANRSSQAKQAYRVVLDPGHGGKIINPDSVYGDKWDTTRGRYLSAFRSGAFHAQTSEFEEMYELAVLIQKYLKLLQTSEGRLAFYKILKKYSPQAAAPSSQQKPLQVFLSREDNYYQEYKKKQNDPNAPYRLFDYANILTEQRELGTISRINALRPHLTVSLHLTKGSAPKNTGGMSAVVTPSHQTFSQALLYSRASLQERKKIRSRFSSGVWRNWFLTDGGRKHFEWFLCDAQIYFTGFWGKKQKQDLELHADREKFFGYRHNMITWAYQDKSGWEKQAIAHAPYTVYAAELKNFTDEGKFWQREKSQEENWRREGGREGYGGDNLYAAHEILRYTRQSLLANNKKNFSELPQVLSPYISTWSVPTYVNAISAYLEVAYIDNEKDYQRITKMKDETAEGIAVGIYSLFYSLPQENSNRGRDLPHGEAIDFERYKNYFFEVVN